jgi:hypothetical protein
VGTAFFVAAAVLVAVLTSPVLAANSKGSSAASLTGTANVPVIFNQEVYARTTDEITAPLEKRITKYTKATMTGTGLHGQAVVSYNGMTLYVPADSISTGEKAIAALEKEQKQEQDSAKAEEEAKAKREAELEAQKKAEQEAADEAARAAEVEAASSHENTTASSGVEAVETVVEQVVAETSYSGSGSLTASAGVFYGPSGKETYYNLDMSGVVAIMRAMGNTDEYWVRSDGVKMLGDYVMVAADLSLRPRGTLVQTSLGMGIVCDTGSFALSNPTQLDIAVNW